MVSSSVCATKFIPSAFGILEETVSIYIYSLGKRKEYNTQLEAVTRYVSCKVVLTGNVNKEAVGQFRFKWVGVLTSGVL